MRNEYERLWERLKNVHQNAQGETYTKETAETPDQFADIINVLIQLDGVEVEICGSWIWASGNTQPYKETLKGLKFRWAHKKRAWYYHTEPYRKKSHRELTFDEIREMFGSERYKQSEEKQPALQA